MLLSIFGLVVLAAILIPLFLSMDKGDTHKKCKFCGKSIKVEVVKCKHCKKLLITYPDD